MTKPNEPSVASVQAWALAQNHQSVSARYAKVLAVELGRLGAEAVAQVALIHKQLGEIDALRNEVGRLQERADFYERKWNELVEVTAKRIAQGGA